MITKKNVINISEYIISMCIILQCNSVWIKMNNFNILMLVIMSVSVIIVMCLVSGDKIKTNKQFIKSVMLVLIINIYLIIYIFSSQPYIDQYIRYFYIAFNIILLYQLFVIDDEFEILIKLSNIVCIIALFSLIFWIFGTNLNIIKPTSQFLLDWGGEYYRNSYFNIYFEAQKIQFLGSSIYRNTGIFAEGPMYSFILGLSLAIQVYLNKELSLKKIILLFITTLTTFSTTGVIAVFFIITSKIGRLKFNTKLMNIIRFACVIVSITITIVVSIFFINDKVGDKDINKASSYSVRLADIKSGIQAFEDNKLFGVGYHNQSEIKKYSSMAGNGSSSMITILAQGGIYLAIFYIIPLFRLFIQSIKYLNFDFVLFIISLLGMLFFTNVPYTFLILYMIGIGYTRKRNII